MKFTDDYTAKYTIWARSSRVVPLPRISNLPHFTSRKFDSYEEFNAWKKERLSQLARSGGAKWTK